jgi:hypothetical protein
MMFLSELVSKAVQSLWKETPDEWASPAEM